MLHYISSERLKFKNSFIKKLIFIAPIITSFIAFIMSTNYYQSQSIYWWYIFILPGAISVFCLLSNDKEEKATKYYGIYSLPINPKRFWMSKIINIFINVFISSILLYILVDVLARVLFPSLLVYSSIEIFTSIMYISIALSWQIPILQYFMFAKKKAIPILLNFILCIFVPAFTSGKSWGMVIPYNWVVKGVQELTGIAGNGVAEATRGENGMFILIIAIVLSLVLFMLFSLIGAVRFADKEVL